LGDLRHQHQQDEQKKEYGNENKFLVHGVFHGL
jgi:hypothetical protein